MKTDVLSTLWIGLNWNNVTKEGSVQLSSGKKPEALIEKILEISTEEGDIVLDSFAGSGTTAAVAHKMGRKWIAVEIGKHAESKIIPRMKAVLGGENQSEIVSNAWKGGGGFKYYNLGPSIIESNPDGSSNFNWSLGKKFIEESFLSSYDYTRVEMNLRETGLFSDEDSIPLVGIQYIGGKSRIAVVTLNPPKGMHEMLAYEELMAIYQKVKKEHSPAFVNVFTNRGIELAADSKPEDLEVIKIPHAVFAELEK